MSEARYTFLPWLRQGMAGKITEADTLGATSESAAFQDERATLNVELVVEDTRIEDDSKGESSIIKTVKLVGPGDVSGINPQAILRTEPRQQVHNFEANLLPYIEFYEEDFPWRFTPAKASDNAPKRLRPWLALVVLKDDEYILFENQEGLSYLSINENALNSVFCSPGELWAWAHVQMNKTLIQTNGAALSDELENELHTDPDIGISRILSPRKLQKNTHYTAFLIPTFETGRLAGLGLPIQGIKAQAASWQQNAGNIVVQTAQGFEPNTFPFYYHWKFSTGQYGDFETLVAVLSPIAVDPENGQLEMDIQNPGFNLNGVAGSKSIGFEGALKPPGFQPIKFPNDRDDEKFVETLQTILNLSINALDAKVDNESLKYQLYKGTNYTDDPIVVPPIYGYWHAMIKRLGLPDKYTYPWIEQLNQDPRYRAAAGLGVKTIQTQQDTWMQQAWEQIGQVNEANQKIEAAKLAKLTNKAIYKKHLSNVNDNKFSMMTGRLHPKVLNSNGNATVNHEIKQSRIPLAAKTSTFRRITRPEKKSIKKLNRQFNDLKAKLHHSVFPDFNSTAGELGNPLIATAKLKPIPGHTISFDDFQTEVLNAEVNYSSQDIYMARDLLFSAAENANNVAQLNQQITAQGTQYNSNVINLASKAISGNNVLSFSNQNETPQLQLSLQSYESLFLNPNDGKATPSSKQYNQVTISRPLKANETPRTGKATSLNDIVEFVATVQSFSTKMASTGLSNGALNAPVNDLRGLVRNTREKLDPQKTIEKRVLRKIKIWKNGSFQAIEKLERVMAYPKIAEPVYQHLQKISQDFILPNVEKLPANSITLLETNQAFIESYLAGLNHEMARELLWREYPTDQRGSYFRQFWDKTDNIFETNPEKKLDIKEMHTWTKNLGQHAVDDTTEAKLVLVVRGDLFLKFPNTLVYAQRAVYDSNAPSEARLLPTETTDSNTLFPIFSAELEPDVFLFGFDLTTTAAIGQRFPSGGNINNIDDYDPGWFFVFRERPGQVKFGLDDFTDQLGDDTVMPPDNQPADWNDMAWEYLVDEKTELDDYLINFSRNIEVSNPPTGTNQALWGDNAADLAAILLQNPVIFGRHAQEMLTI